MHVLIAFLVKNVVLVRALHKIVGPSRVDVQLNESIPRFSSHGAAVVNSHETARSQRNEGRVVVVHKPSLPVAQWAIRWRCGEPCHTQFNLQVLLLWAYWAVANAVPMLDCMIPHFAWLNFDYHANLQRASQHFEVLLGFPTTDRRALAKGRNQYDVSRIHFPGKAAFSVGQSPMCCQRLAAQKAFLWWFGWLFCGAWEMRSSTWRKAANWPTEVFLLGALRLEAGDEEPDKSCMDMLDWVSFCFSVVVAMLQYWDTAWIMVNDKVASQLFRHNCSKNHDCRANCGNMRFWLRLRYWAGKLIISIGVYHIRVQDSRSVPGRGSAVEFFMQFPPRRFDGKVIRQIAEPRNCSFLVPDWMSKRHRHIIFNGMSPIMPYNQKFIIHGSIGCAIICNRLHLVNVKVSQLFSGMAQALTSFPLKSYQFRKQMSSSLAQETRGS